MDIVLAILGTFFIMGGIAGCILPVLPGPVIGYGGLILLELTKYADFSAFFLIIFAVVAVGVILLDYFVPIWGTKRYGGSKYGIWGATIGVFIGIFMFPPLGIIIFPIIGAIIGEMIRGANTNESFKAGFGSFIGFLLGTGLKLISVFVMAFYYFRALFT